MLAPGVPSSVAEAIARNESDPRAMAKAVVTDVMSTKYRSFGGDFGPAGAFDVLDLDAAKIGRAKEAIAAFNHAVEAGKSDGAMRGALRDDVRSVGGMVRFPSGKELPWRADRPAMAVYGAIASDARLDAILRADALAAKQRIGDLVLAHRESRGFEPFDGASYRDAAGPTMHFPTSRASIDPWSRDGMSETDNAFYRDVDQAALTGVLA